MLNTLVLTFTDIQFGRTVLLGATICLNFALFLQQGKTKVPKYLYIGLALFLYLCLRQAILLMDNVLIYSETLSAILFAVYTVSFALFINIISNSSTILMVRFFLYLNLCFGIPDFFRIHLPFLHVEVSDIFGSARFRGLATEPNLLAIPVLIILYGLLNCCYRYSFKKVDIIVCLLMIYFSYSKAAYLGLLFIWLQTFHLKINYKNILRTTLVLGLLYLLLIKINLNSYLYETPIYTGFISLMDYSLIVSNGINEYIVSLTNFDQFRSGSLGTRLATAVATVHTVFSSGYIFLFGVGGGNSYPYLIEYIYDNGLNNYELDLHMSYNPQFITDKTYILKFLTEYGFAGLALLIAFMFNASRVINPSIKTQAIRIIFYFITCMFLCQSTLLFTFILITIKVFQAKQLRT